MENGQFILSICNFLNVSIPSTSKEFWKTRSAYEISLKYATL